MKVVLIAVAVISAMGAVAEEKKGWWVALFIASVLLHIALGALGGMA